MTASSNPTTGLGTAARVRITSNAPTLILSNTNTGQLLTYQITAEATDVEGNILDPQPQLYYNLLAGFDVAEVSDTGLVTGIAPGQAIVQVSAAAFGAVPGAFTPDGIPQTGVVYAEQSIQVTEGYITPDFFFTVSSLGGGSYQISQHPETNSTFSGAVTYVLGPPNSPTAAVFGAITGTGTLNFSSSSPNFILTGTYLFDGVPQTYHQVWSAWGAGTFPVQSVRVGGGGFGVSGHASNSSGQPYQP
jgi:hypothetical protein